MVAGKSQRVVVVGSAGRDLAIGMTSLPEANASAPIERTMERLGGKGANIAAGIRQLNPECSVFLIAVLGVDRAGEAVLEDALDLGIDTASVARRGETSLLVDLVDDSAERRILEQVSPEASVREEDVRSAAMVLGEARVVVLQLRQPVAVLARAAELAPGAVVVLDGGFDGAVDSELAERLLTRADMVRANGEEAEMLAGHSISSVSDAERAAADLLNRGPSIVSLTVSGSGDLVAWEGGSQFFPFGDEPVVDRTGAGDAYVAGLVTGLLRDEPPRELGRRASAAATTAVQQFGGFTRFAERSRVDG